MGSHTPEDQAILDAMLPNDKILRTSRKAMYERWIVMSQFWNWTVAQQEFRFDDRGSTQLIIWYDIPNITPTDHDFAVLMSEVREQYSYLYFTHNPKNLMSIKSRYHVHLYSL